MITCQQIEDLELIIDYLNNSDNIQNENFNEKVEDFEQLLTVLSKIKISRIKKVRIKPIEKRAKSRTYNHDKEKIMQIFSSSSPEEIIEKYSLNELKDMFFAVYDTKPMSKTKKEDIVNAIEKMRQQIQRVEGFKELEQ